MSTTAKTPTAAEMDESTAHPGEQGGGFHEAIAVLVSWLEMLWNRAMLMMRPTPYRHRGPERRRNPRTCPLCSGPMQHDGQRPPRDTRGDGAKIRRLPEEVLTWFRCGRCKRAQIGVPPSKLATGRVS